MEITCSQMDVLLSFYIEGDLSRLLKKKVEEHLKHCPACRAKYEIIKSMIDDLRESVDEGKTETAFPTHQYKYFRNNLSAYMDNELPAEENIKIKKYTINNKQARKELEDSYNIRRLMSESFKKTASETRQDFSKAVIRQLEPEQEYNLSVHPLIKTGAAFVMTILILSAIIIFAIIS